MGVTKTKILRVNDKQPDTLLIRGDHCTFV